MTAPVSLAPAALPAAAGTGATPAGPDDVFASVLAALSGALGLPVPVPVQEQPQGPDAAVTQKAAVAGPALPAPGTTDAAPGVWAAVTQRPVLPGAPPTALVSTGAGEVQATPAHPPRTPLTRVGAPATEEARRPEVAAPAVPAPQAAPAVDPSTVPPTPVAPAAPTAGVHAEATAATSTHHVKPALVEAARGLRHEGGGRTSLVVRLDPPELGAVLVKLTVQDGRVDVTLRTPDLAARADLQAQSYDVEQVLREQGFDLSSYDVAHGDVLPEGRQDAPDRGTPDRGRRADGHTAHSPVTDDGPAPEPSGTWL